jgi:hypothetical protein
MVSNPFKSKNKSTNNKIEIKASITSIKIYPDRDYRIKYTLECDCLKYKTESYFFINQVDFERFSVEELEEKIKVILNEKSLEAYHSLQEKLKQKQIEEKFINKKFTITDEDAVVSEL